MLKIAFRLLFLLALAACTALPDAAAKPLLNTHWRALEIDGKATSAAAAHPAPHLVLDATGQAFGSDGCNRFHGAYVRAAGLHLAQLASTMMACLPTVDAQARAFLVALAATQNYRIHGDRLELRDADGRVRLLLEASIPQ